mmetsp:Transcript_136019/g.290787  ORF Transcript_136019/g.290787 Transcript_136019/m.290787 type:complete len:314 (-) Transcript_136019:74-1015(-)
MPAAAPSWQQTASSSSRLRFVEMPARGRCGGSYGSQPPLSAQCSRRPLVLPSWGRTCRMLRWYALEDMATRVAPARLSCSTAMEVVWPLVRSLQKRRRRPPRAWVRRASRMSLMLGSSDFASPGRRQGAIARAVPMAVSRRRCPSRSTTASMASVPIWGAVHCWAPRRGVSWNCGGASTPLGPKLPRRTRSSSRRRSCAMAEVPLREPLPWGQGPCAFSALVVTGRRSIWACCSQVVAASQCSTAALVLNSAISPWRAQRRLRPRSVQVGATSTSWTRGRARKSFGCRCPASSTPESRVARSYVASRCFLRLV